MNDSPMNTTPRRRLRMDMHVHTRISYDSLNEPDRLRRAAVERGLDRVVITDHNEIEGARIMHALDPERFLVGEEVKTREGADVIGILLTERIPKNTPARETCERIRAQGGVVYLPHPFDTRRSGGAHLLDELADVIDVIEAHNARCYRPELNQQAAAWAKEHGFLVGAGSDAHTISELGRGAVELPAFEPTREGLLAALGEATLSTCERSSPLVSVASTYAKLRKHFPGA